MFGVKVILDAFFLAMKRNEIKAKFFSWFKSGNDKANEEKEAEIERLVELEAKLEALVLLQEKIEIIKNNAKDSKSYLESANRYFENGGYTFSKKHPVQKKFFSVEYNAEEQFKYAACVSTSISIAQTEIKSQIEEITTKYPDLKGN